MAAAHGFAAMSKSPRATPEQAQRVQSGVYGMQPPRRVLSASAACLRLLEALPVAVVLVSARGEILHGNLRAHALLGRQPGELEGQTLEEVGTPLSSLLETEESRWRLRLPTGEERVVGCRLAVVEEIGVEAEKGKYLVVFDDETTWDRVASERDRLLRLAAVGEVLPAVLHELKNPLAAVTTSVEVLLEETEHEPLRADLYAILSELRRMRLTLDGAGTVGARLTSTRYQAVDHAVREACQVLERPAAVGGVKVSCEVEDMPLLLLDAAVLRAIVFNLVQNAVQACKDGGHVNVEARRSEGDFVLSVADDGCGMAPETVARCRELFFTTKTRGSGIGLSLCNQIAADAGGSLEIDSKPGVGTTVVVRVPAGQRRMSSPANTTNQENKR